jgi:condensin complex subunit 1
MVRKNCIVLLNKLIETHPYGVMHGGDLNATEWAKRYEHIAAELKPIDDAIKNAADKMVAESPRKARAEGDEEEADVKQEADASQPSTNGDLSASQRAVAALNGMSHEELLGRLDSEQLAKLRLMKRYYADARSFIRYLEEGFTDKEDNEKTGAIEKVTELLNSTTKSEVLEAMHFLTTCHKYKMETADKGVRALLHLVWAKDASTTEVAEDGKKAVEVKGVRPTLVDCYNQIYIEDDPEMDAKANINRTTKNFIQCARSGDTDSTDPFAGSHSAPRWPS